jgi:hypothetical protein
MTTIELIHGTVLADLIRLESHGAGTRHFYTFPCGLKAILSLAAETAKLNQLALEILFMLADSAGSSRPWIQVIEDDAFAGFRFVEGATFEPEGTDTRITSSSGGGLGDAVIALAG